jgi:hypothetical protein
MIGANVHAGPRMRLTLWTNQRPRLVSASMAVWRRCQGGPRCPGGGDAAAGSYFQTSNGGAVGDGCGTGVIVAGLLIFACASLLGLAAWVVILPPRERNGFEDYDLRESARWERDN